MTIEGEVELEDDQQGSCAEWRDDGLKSFYWCYDDGWWVNVYGTLHKIND